MSSTNGNGKKKCYLQWFINSRCDYACRHCTPPDVQPRDLNEKACLEALQSYADFTAEREATIAFYPRQAALTDRFTTVLRAAAELKKKGRLTSMRTVHRGDLPSDKIRLYQECGVDVCQLTIDAPEAIQDKNRRPGSFRDTLRAFREVQDAGMQVVVLMIVARFNAPYLPEMLRIVLDQGVDEVVLQVGVDVNANRGPVPGGTAPEENPWCQGLSANAYRDLLVGVLRFLDTLGPQHADFRRRLILNTPMFARLFSELGRLEEYEPMRAKTSERPGRAENGLRLLLQPEGEVRFHQDLPRLGTFPGASFSKMYANSDTLQILDDESRLANVWAEERPRFTKCHACPVADSCRPALVGASGSRLFFYPDDHCWVNATGIESAP